MTDDKRVGGVNFSGVSGGKIETGAIDASVTINIYKTAPPEQIEPNRLKEALEKLAALPLDEIPPTAGLPPGSRMPMQYNPYFVGRGDELRRLAAILKEGKTAAIGQIAAIEKGD